MSEAEFAKVWPRIIKTSPKGTPMLIPGRTGKVILVRDNGDHEIIEGCHYSNVDSRSYDSDNNPHPLFEKLQGNKFGLKFCITDQDRTGKEFNYDGIFLSPFLLGEMGPIDWQHLWESKKFEADFNIKLGSLTGYNDPHLKDFLGGASASFITFTAPDVSYTDTLPLIVFLSFALVLDEQFDNHNWFQSHKIPYQKFLQIKTKLMEVTKSEKTPEEQEVDFDFPMLKPMCEYMAVMRDEIKKMSSTEEIFQRYVKHMHDSLDTVGFNNCKEWNEYKAACKTGTAHRAHWDLRRLDLGCEPYFDFQLMTYANQLPREIHESHIFGNIFESCALTCMFANDVMSYAKEVFDKETCNSLIVRHVDENMEFMKALESCIVDCNKAVVDIIQIGNLLLEIVGKDDNYESLQRAIYLIKACTFGHIQWYSYARRYRGGVNYDCVVYLNDDMVLEQLKII